MLSEKLLCLGGPPMHSFDSRQGQRQTALLRLPQTRRILRWTLGRCRFGDEVRDRCRRNEPTASDDDARKFPAAKQSVDRIPRDPAQEFACFFDGVECAVIHDGYPCVRREDGSRRETDRGSGPRSASSVAPLLGNAREIESRVCRDFWGKPRQKSRVSERIATFRSGQCQKPRPPLSRFLGSNG